MRTHIKDRAKGGLRGAALPLCLAVVSLCLASCVAPKTLEEAGKVGGFRTRDYPQCVQVRPDIHGLGFTKPAIDIGNGMVAVVSESRGFAPELGPFGGRTADLIDCETGLGLRFEEDLVAESDDPARPQTLSADPEFRSPLERLLAALPSSGQNGSLRTISAHMAANGAKSNPWSFWAPDADYDFNDEETCGCALYYPEIERHWFDKRKVGPDYPEALGENPRNLKELEAQMTALRSRE